MYGPDKYSDDHPQGAFHRAMRDKARQARALREAGYGQGYASAVLQAEGEPLPSAVTATQIAEAEQAGDTRQAGRLKAVMSRQLRAEMGRAAVRRAGGSPQ